MLYYDIEELSTPDYTDARGEVDEYNRRAKKLHTALSLLLRGVPLKLDNGKVVALAWTEEGELVPLVGDTEPDKGERIRIAETQAKMVPKPDWTVRDFFSFLMDNISDDRHFLMCGSLALTDSKGG